MSSALKGAFMRNWYRTEAVPLYAVTGLALVGAGWYLTRLARGPEVVWDKKNNPTPWNNIEEGTQVKLLAVSQSFDKNTIVLDDNNNPMTISSIMVKQSGEKRFCQKCQNDKPDRTHHCKMYLKNGSSLSMVKINK
ncbi:8796_t:CDS:2 [Entrophospora sp. SA101]|nr:12935_t:CDS:2 [Entrophospora sp. SA101]CAJ0650829.1 8796_t:CDS:2 [Entrophospora sp. SA101]